MDALRGFPWDVVGGLASLGLLFLLREFASGALRQAGEDAWKRSRWGRPERRFQLDRCRGEDGGRFGAGRTD